jgi:pimeloyl-ACP methyl ester carboxylesterase
MLAGFEARFAEPAPGAGRIRYLVAGSGPPILLVHGLGGAASNWAVLAPILARRYRVVVPDLPGHGGSDPLRGASGLDAFAEGALAAAAAERLDQATVVGHSLGGAVALRAAGRAHGAVDRLVLAAPAGISSSSRRNRVALALTTTLRPGRAAARFRSRVAADPRLARACFFALAEARLTPEAIHGFLAGAADASDTRTAARALLAEDLRLEIDRVRCPVLLLWGARDRILPPDDAFEYARRLRAQLRLLPRTGHLLIGERPEECAALIEDFVSRAR